MVVDQLLEAAEALGVEPVVLLPEEPEVEVIAEVREGVASVLAAVREAARWN